MSVSTCHFKERKTYFLNFQKLIITLICMKNSQKYFHSDFNDKNFSQLKKTEVFSFYSGQQ